MPEGPTIVVFKKKLEKFSGKIVTESGGYNNPYQDQIAGKKLISLGTFGKYLLLDFGDFLITVHFGLYGSFLINEQKKVNASFSLFFDEDHVNFYVVKIKKIADKNVFNEKLNVFSEQYDVAATKNYCWAKNFLHRKLWMY